MSELSTHMDNPIWRNYSFFESTVCGIPCQVAFSWSPACRGLRENGIQMEPDEPEGPDEVLVFDRRGYHAVWLEEKAERESVDLYVLVLEYVRAERERY